MAREDVSSTNALASPTSEASFYVTENESLVKAKFEIDFGPLRKSSLELSLSGKIDGDEIELANISDLPRRVKGKLKFTQAFAMRSGDSLTAICRTVNQRSQRHDSAHNAQALYHLRRARTLKGKESYQSYLDAATL